jgi:Skp family chaperone for outer membrane proteins
MKNTFLLLGVFIFSFLFAQTSKPADKITIGYFNYDSVLVLLPGYKEMADTFKICNEQVEKMQNEIKSKQEFYDANYYQLKPKARPVIEEELKDLRARLNIFKRYNDSIQQVKLVRFELKLTEAINKIAQTKGYATVLNSKTPGDFVLWAEPGINFVDVTSEICRLFQIDK